MIYIDSSVVLAHLLLEKRMPPKSLWDDDLISSRLLAYEVWNRIHAFQFARSHRNEVEDLFEGIEFVEIAPIVLERALRPFPVAVRTLDSLHLASIEFVRGQGETVALASYDKRLSAAAEALGISLYPL